MRGGLRKLAADIRPVPMAPLSDGRVSGTGLYLRTDYWNQLTSGGSYGHTCYVARELASASDGMVCLMASHYSMLDEFGLTQVVMPKASASAAEIPILAATWHYLPLVKFACELLRPAYIYERLCLGNFVGAMVSRELGIPYILEYNGSEISMSKTFNGTEPEIRGAVHPRRGCRLQAGDDDHGRVEGDQGIAGAARYRSRRRSWSIRTARIPTRTRRPSPEEKTAIRRDIGFRQDDRVVGFTGTFGGWHGIEVLAEAMPPICARDERIKFLLIGDGSHKGIIDRAVAQHQLGDRVAFRRPRAAAGRRAVVEGVRRVRVAAQQPHARQQVLRIADEAVRIHGGGRGHCRQRSRTTRRGAVAGAAPGRAVGPPIGVTDERAVLCEPGNVAELTAGVIALAKRPSSRKRTWAATRGKR